jgi:beta-glucosidase
MEMSKWQRYKFMPVRPLGEDGKIVTGSKEHIALSRKVAAEGMVLLKNENRLLPLKRGSQVALFGKASVDYVKGGGGSGDVTVAYVRNLCDGMEEKAAEGKVNIFAPLHEFYRENVASQRAAGKEPGFTVEPEIPAALLEQAAMECDTAVISICRFSAEDWDRKGVPNDGDFYLSLEEQKMVSDASSHFDRIVVVLNVGGMVDTSWFACNPKIGAVLLAWQGGMEGAMAEADILCGDVNPSGKLTDTFAASFDDYPSSAGFNESRDYVCYTEDIFVGYRYFETIPGAAEKVNYPFGFGLSYTTFRLEPLISQGDDERIFVTVRVTNTGNTTGREVVQVYSSAPQSRLDMPKLELRAFQKTRLLQPGQAQELTLTFPTAELAAYDGKLAAFVLPAGSYTILVGNCVRALEEVGHFVNETERITEQVKNRCVPAKLPRRLKADGSFEDLKTGEYPALYDTAGWPEKHSWDAEHILPDTTGVKPPEGRLNFEQAASGEVTTEAFLESLTDDELITLLGGTPNRGVADTRGIGGLDYLGIPAVMTADGPAGLRIVPDRGVKTTAWPVATLLACTWDTELIYAVGQTGAKEVLENNIGMWLTPAINIHRSPLCGRNFEYYSEDPLVAGKLAAAMVRGIQSQNVSACVKHFCCNNKETNRYASDSRVSERALREIYLKAFEIVVKESDVWSIMTAYNLLNGTYTSENEELLTGILREEWGYTGLIVTDWGNWAEHYREALAGNNVRMPHGSLRRLQKAMELGLISRNTLIENARQVLQWMLRLE